MRSSARLAACGFLLCLHLSAADVTGIWMGQIAVRNNEKQELAFQFKAVKGVPTGIMFGDEFDLPVEELNISAERIHFAVTTINYYDGRRTKFIFDGSISERSMELTRQRAGADTAATPAKPQDAKQTLTLKKLT